jgi:peptidyl-dipeptidase Dcp
MQNPLLDKFSTPFETVPFDKIKEEHFLPALKAAIERGRKDIEAIKNNPEKPTFHNVCEAFDLSGRDVEIVSTVFFNLHSAECSDALQAIAKEFSPILTDYLNDIMLDAKLFAKVKTVYDSRNSLNFTAEEKTLLEKSYKSFVRNGSLLDETAKNRLREIDKEMAHLKLVFGDNVLKETNAFELWIESQADLAGLPEGAVEAAALAAKEKGQEGKWLVTLDVPSFMPFMTYSEIRPLREKMFKAYASRSFKGNEFDNRENIKKIAILRAERARLLGYKTHADFVLEERMAAKPETVVNFLGNFLDKAKPAAEREMNELREFAASEGFSDQLQSWDYAFYAEKLKKKKHDVDDEILKPYFKLENVVEGVFKVAHKLYGLNFRERKDIPVYHPDVRAYEVVDETGFVGVFYADFFPRTGKRNGAWMTSYRGQRMKGNVDQRPHVSIVCNFTKPTASRPSLLTFNEVLTLFHEFGHSLHGLLSKCTYEGLSGTSVYWDFVELPSQVMENWAYEKECLDLFATHYQTGKSIPQEYIAKIKASSNFHEGRNTMRQIAFSQLDMAWHSHEDPSKITDVDAFETEATAQTQVLPRVPGTNSSCAFSHIFQGGYSAGYYSYKWAEVLDADAFEFFKEKGIFNRDVANRFRDNVLSKGGSEHPMTLYRRFRGKEPTPEALLRRAGLA